MNRVGSRCRNLSDELRASNESRSAPIPRTCSQCNAFDLANALNEEEDK